MNMNTLTEAQLKMIEENRKIAQRKKRKRQEMEQQKKFIEESMAIMDEIDADNEEPKTITVD